MHSPRLNGMQGAGANVKANGLRMPTVGLRAAFSTSRVVKYGSRVQQHF
jgi:hypothetical protein